MNVPYYHRILLGPHASHTFTEILESFIVLLACCCLWLVPITLLLFSLTPLLAAQCSSSCGHCNAVAIDCASLCSWCHCHILKLLLTFSLPGVLQHYCHHPAYKRGEGVLHGIGKAWVWGKISMCTHLFVSLYNLCKKGTGTNKPIPLCN